MHDRQIAEQLADEGFVTGTGKRWSMIDVRNMSSHHAIPRTAPTVPTAKPLPDRRDDGLYSVLGAARHFGVTRDVVRLWIARGLVRCSGELGRAHGPLWLAIDEAAELHLRDLAEDSRRRLSRRRRPGPHPAAFVIRVRGTGIEVGIVVGVVRKDNVPVGALPAAFPLVGFEFNLSRMCRCQHGQHRSRGVAGPDWPCSGRERDAVDCALWSVQTPQHVSYAPPDSGLEGGRATGSPAYQSGHSSFSRCRSA